jgi:hypothetical protein
MVKLITFGEVEGEVRNQMLSALEKSKADYGVLCADNHLGYSVPVGGVLAIEGGICVNGVGYWELLEQEITMLTFLLMILNDAGLVSISVLEDLDIL